MMMKSLLPVAAVLILLDLATRAEASNGPLFITPQTSDWTVKYQKDASGETYTLVPPDSQVGDFAFSRWTAPGNSDQISGYLDTLAKGFIDAAQRNPKIQLDSTDYVQGEFIGDPYSGKFVEFTFKSGIKDVLFMFGDSNGLWYGHYIGTPDGWLNAMEVLKSIQIRKG